MDSGQNQISVPRVPLGGIDLGFLVFPRAIVALYQYTARKARITFIQKETISLSQSKTISTSYLQLINNIIQDIHITLKSETDCYAAYSTFHLFKTCDERVLSTRFIHMTVITFY